MEYKVYTNIQGMKGFGALIFYTQRNVDGVVISSILEL